MAYWFFFIIMAAIFLAVWEAVGNIAVPIVLLDILMAMFPDMFPAAVYPMVYIINIFGLAIVILFKPIAPTIQK
jgi:hypothetical protein